MTIRTLADVNDAFDAGRAHLQRFMKNAGNNHSEAWFDATFSSGQPSYDARVGTALAFNRAIAAGNDAIYFPGINPGEERYLHSVVMRLTQGTPLTGPCAVLFDLLGYYPMIDGDSTDTQYFDNTYSLPRYADGDGVGMVIVNHVAPPVQNGDATIEYVDSDGNTKSVAVGLSNNGANMVASSASSVAGIRTGALTSPLASGSKGVRRVNSITYGTPPGGLHCIYLIKPLATILFADNGLAVEKEFLSMNGCKMPRIYDGAWLGWFSHLGVGTNTSSSWWGHFQFVWG